MNGQDAHTAGRKVGRGKTPDSPEARYAWEILNQRIPGAEVTDAQVVLFYFAWATLYSVAETIAPEQRGQGWHRSKVKAIVRPFMEAAA